MPVFLLPSARACKGFVVYKNTNAVNGKFYIGKCSQTVAMRMGQHCARVREGSKTKLHNAIRKYGEGSFFVTVLAKCSSDEEAYCLEQRLIVALKPQYNLTDGGRGVFGRKVSEDQKRRQSEKMKGRPNPKLRGRVMTAEHLAKIVATKRARWPTEAELNNWSTAHLRFPPRKTCRVRCIETGDVFDSIKEAGIAYGGARAGNLCDAIIGGYAYRGFHFERLP